MKRRGTISRPRYVAVTDKRSPMLRLLQDYVHPDGYCEVEYDAQWRTKWKAQRLGYLDVDGNLTDKGRAFVGQS